MQKTPPRDRVGLIVPPPFWYLAGLIVAWLLARAYPLDLVPYLARLLVGWPLLVIGMALMAWAVASFARAHTPIAPISPTTTVVQTGPYRITRNPMYVGMAFMMAGISLLANWLWGIALLPLVLVFVQTMAIAREESFLTERFGQIYTDYRARVRRWL